MGCPRPNVPRSDPYSLGELEKDLRDRLYTLFHDAPTRGLTLVSGYRDPGRQWDLRHDRVPGRECDPRAKAVPATAVPATWNGREWVGGSRHQHRKAADIGGRELAWAIANRARYGLGLTVLSENWHYEAHGTDARTRRPIPAPAVRILTYPGPCWDDKPGTPPLNEGALTVGQYEDLKAEIAANELRQYAADKKRDERLAKLEQSHRDGAAGDRQTVAWVKAQFAKLQKPKA